MRASVAAKRANPLRRNSNWDDELRQQLNRRDVEPILSMRVEDVGEAVEDADAVRRFLRFCIEYGHPVLRGDERLEKLHFFSSRRRHTTCSRDWSSDVCSSD